MRLQASPRTSWLRALLCVALVVSLGTPLTLSVPAGDEPSRAPRISAPASTPAPAQVHRNDPRLDQVQSRSGSETVYVIAGIPGIALSPWYRGAPAELAATETASAASRQSGRSPPFAI